MEACSGKPPTFAESLSSIDRPHPVSHPLFFSPNSALVTNAIHCTVRKIGALPSLDLPKVRRDELVEIVPLSTGCLGACTYCKTRYAHSRRQSPHEKKLTERFTQQNARFVFSLFSLFLSFPERRERENKRRRSAMTGCCDPGARACCVRVFWSLAPRERERERRFYRCF